jgi:hypothetical protein
MSQMIYQVSVGKPSKLYQHCIASVARYCEKYDIEHVIQTTPKLWIKPDPFMSNRSAECQARPLPLPIFEKENAFVHLKTRDQVAIIDADIYIRNSAPNIFNEIPSEMAFGGVVEREMPITEAYKRKILNYSHMQYDPLGDVNWDWHPQLGGHFYNMGLMLMNSSFEKYLDGDTPEQFIKRPEFKRFVDGEGTWKWSTDQTLLNYWVKKRNVPSKNLDWRWNALYKGVRDEYLPEAHFIHFFLKDKLPAKGENVEQLMRDINEN